MAITLQSAIGITMSWAFQDTLDLSTAKDNGDLPYSATLLSGTAASLCDRVWHDQRIITAGANDDLDLTALTASIFGSTVTITMVKVRFIVIAVTTTTAGALIRWMGNVTNAFIKPFNDITTTQLNIHADSPCVLGNKVDGWTVTNSSNDIIRLTNPGASSVTYRIGILGTSA